MNRHMKRAFIRKKWKIITKKGDNHEFKNHLYSAYRCTYAYTFHRMWNGRLIRYTGEQSTDGNRIGDIRS